MLHTGYILSSIGDWMILLVHVSKQFGWELSGLTGRAGLTGGPSEAKVAENTTDGATHLHSPPLFSGVQVFVLLSVTVTFVSYYGLGGWLQYYYYIKRREQVRK